MNERIIIGLNVSNRMKNALDLQKLFSEFGCNIKTMLGMHDVNDNTCSPAGLILLKVFGGNEVAKKMIDKFNAIEGVDAQMMRFAL